MRGRDNLLNKWCWDSWRITCKKMKLDHILYILSHKINSKWIEDLNVRPGTILREERQLVPGQQSRQWFFNLTPKAKATEANISK